MVQKADSLGLYICTLNTLSNLKQFKQFLLFHYLGTSVGQQKVALRLDSARKQDIHTHLRPWQPDTLNNPYTIEEKNMKSNPIKADLREYGVCEDGCQETSK